MRFALIAVVLSGCFFNPMAQHGIDLAPLQPKPSCASFCGGDEACIVSCKDGRVIIEPDNPGDNDDDPPQSAWERLRC